MGNLGLGDRNPRELRDAANGGGINGHKYRPQTGNSHPPYSRGRFCAATAGTGGAGLGTPNIRLLEVRSRPRPDARDFERQAPISLAKRPDETIFPPYIIVRKQSGDVVAARTSGGRVMSTIEMTAPDRKAGILLLVLRDRARRRDRLPRLLNLTHGRESHVPG
jgi:hypothetical protein